MQAKKKKEEAKAKENNNEKVDKNIAKAQSNQPDKVKDVKQVDVKKIIINNESENKEVQAKVDIKVKDEQEDEIIDDYGFDDENDKEPQKVNDKEGKSSPLLDKTTKEKLINLGQSLDSKQLADALGYIDLRLLLKCFAKAVMKHINYSQGYLFLEDLKMAQSQQDELNFTYGLNQNMKINIDKRGREEIDELSASK